MNEIVLKHHIRKILDYFPDHFSILTKHELEQAGIKVSYDYLRDWVNDE